METQKLSNGISFCYYNLPNTHSVCIGLYVLCGSVYETEENNGISHFLEHLHFRKLGNLTQNELYYTLESMGTTLEAATHKEFTRYSMKIQPGKVNEAVDIIAMLIQTYNWSEDDFEKEKKVVIDQIEERDSFEYIDDFYIDKTMWGDGPLSYPIMGWEDNIKALSLNEIIEYKKAFFQPDKLIFIITGCVKENDIQIIKNTLGNIKFETPSQYIDYPEINFIKKKPSILFDIRSWGVIDVNIAFSINYNIISREKTTLLNCILGAGIGSILVIKIREELGLSSNIHSYIKEYKELGIINISFSSCCEKFYIILKEIIKILNEMKQQISQKDLMSSIPFYSDNSYFLYDDTEELNLKIFYDLYILNKNCFNLDDEINLYKNITREELQRISNSIFKSENLFFTVSGKCKKFTKKEIKKILEDL